MSDLNEKKEITKEEFAANEIKAFCAYVMHPESDLHKDAEDWIKERLQTNGAEKSDSNCNIPLVVSWDDFNIGDIVEYDGYTCIVKEKNRQKCLAIPMPMGLSYFIPNWADVKRM